MKTKREVSAKAVPDKRREHPVRKPLNERERKFSGGNLPIGAGVAKAVPDKRREHPVRKPLNERERKFSGGNLPIGAGVAKAVPDKRREHPVGADTVRSVPDAA